MSIKLLDDEQMIKIVTAAILTHIDPDKRDELIKETLKSLLEVRERPHPTKSYATVKYSPLQEAFEVAANKAAMEIMTEQFAKDTPARNRIKSVVTKATNKWLNETNDKLVDAIVDALKKSTHVIEFKEKERY